MYNKLNVQHSITFHFPLSTFPQQDLPFKFVDGFDVDEIVIDANMDKVPVLDLENPANDDEDLDALQSP